MSPAIVPESLSYLTPKGVEHEINGVKKTFYPMSLGMASKLKPLTKPIGNALAILFGDKRSDRGYTIRKLTNIGDQSAGEENVFTAISTDLAQKRTEEREKAILLILEALGNAEGMNILASIIADSMRDDFKRPVEEAQVQMLSQHLTIPMLAKHLAGVGKANAELFGPLAERVKKVGAAVLTRVEKEAQGDQKENSPDGEADQEQKMTEGPTSP